MSQERIVVRLLRERGKVGVSAHELNYRYGITRGAAVIHKLRTEHGFEIETIDEGPGKMARYVLTSDPNPVAAKQPPPEVLNELPPPAELVFACGCVRAADGRSWKERCDTHSGVPEYKPGEATW